MYRFNAYLAGLIGILCFPIASDSQAAEDTLPELTAWIDQRFEQQYELIRQRVPEVVDDATFLRRIYLDLAGRIPVVSEVRDFTSDRQPNKRLRVINQLLDDARFSSHTARVWRRILLPPNATANANFAVSLDRWLEDQFSRNASYDEIARRLVTAGGAETEVPAAEDEPPDQQPANLDESPPSSPIAYLQNTGGQPANMASSVSRVFLGIRLECAQCHDHPFTTWRQRDFWGVAAFFSGARLTNQRVLGRLNAEQQTPVVDSRSTSITDESGTAYQAALLWMGDEVDIELPPDEVPRQYFARWMTSADNPHFAATAVNRIWQHLCGSGLTDSVDDLDQASDAERELILDDLAEKFAAGGFDVKGLVRAICASRFYQRPSESIVVESAVDARPLKVLTPEQLFDSLEVALALPISRIDQGPRYNGQRDALVSRMEEALGERPDDFRSGIPQALALMNGQITANATDLKTSRTLRAVVDAPFFDLSEKVDTLFLTTLSRPPHQPEREKFVSYIKSKGSDQEKAEAYSEIMWALINSPEFVLIR